MQMMMTENSRAGRAAAARASLLSVLVVLSVTDAQAYIDPGTGSMLLQMGLAAIAGAMFYFRQFRLLVAAWFRRVVLRQADVTPARVISSSQDAGQ
jgi:hypothetical protein